MFFCFFLSHQLMIKNDPKRLISSVKINVTRKKLLPLILKNQIINSPSAVMIIPPINSHFQAIKVKIINTNQGRALGLLSNMDLRLLSIAPETKAKMKTSTPSTNKKYLAVYLRTLAAINLFFMIIIFRAPVFHIILKNIN